MACSKITRHGNGFKDISGSRVGRWTVVRYSHTKGKDAFWWCRCDCGKERAVRSGNLLKNATLSCGCLWREVASSHGEGGRRVRSKEYNAWRGMKTRATLRSGPGAKNYALRGITVCKQWVESFESFLGDVGRAPSPQHTIERIDNDKGYEPGNVRWATRAEQNRNTRKTVLITFDGQTLCLTDWSRLLGVGVSMIQRRIKTLGVEEGMRKCGAGLHG